MKYLFIIFLTLSLFGSCKSKGKALAEQIQKTMEEIPSGSIQTKEGGWAMQATMKGEGWTALTMMPTEATSRIIGYSKKDWISLPYDRRYLVEGKIIKFGESNAVDISTDGHAGFWAGKTGEMEITKVDDTWAEGKFHFTATTSESNETFEVTDGFFRVPLSGHP